MPPSKKKKKQPPRLQSTSDPLLPDDLLLSCLARVSRLHYPTLSLVSKSFRSLISSPDLYKARSLLGRTDICLYVCIGFHSENPKWFTLCRKPDKTLTSKKEKKKSNRHVLAKVPISHSPPVNNWGNGPVGSSIYNIGGSRSSSSVSVMDCTSHKWSEAPSFRVNLRSLTACVVERKIYVAGSYDDGDPNSWNNSIEVLDTETQIWEPLPIHTKCFLYRKSACIDGKFQLETDSDIIAYDSKEGKWDLVRKKMNIEKNSYPYCQIENVLYSVCGSTFRWYDKKSTGWRFMKSFKGLPQFPRGASVSLADYGGKMVVLWDEECLYDRRFQKKIWCAVIALERRSRSEILGKVEWFDVVLIVPEGCNLVKALAVTV